MDQISYNVYCDESCHLENDGMPVMVLGGAYCREVEVKRISDKIRDIKEKHGLPRSFEAKWTKVSESKVDFYLELISLYLDSEKIRFRGVLIPDKSKLDHQRFDQDHDDWYYKMYYTMLRYVFIPPYKYNVYLDIKDTRGGSKTRNLHDVLCNSLLDFQQETVVKVQQIRSHESELLQIADLVIGAISYENRGLDGSSAKLKIINHLKNNLGSHALSRSSPFGSRKFNILCWRANEASS